MMNGLELSKSYYYEMLEPRIRSRCPHLLERMAVGLFGHGSQCLGFDDAISQDHDWGPRVCLLLNDEDYPKLRPDLEAALAEAPSDYHGFKTSWEWLDSRGGVLKINDWFRQLLECKEIPEQPADWLPIREHQLLWATNGEIWHDGLGEVTELRRTLSHYPEAVWMARVAAKCAEISQSSGNVKRSFQREDTVAAWFALHYFAKHAMQIWFLLNRQYAPFYKWLHRAFLDLPELPDGLDEDILLLASSQSLAEKERATTRTLATTRKAISARFPSTSKLEQFWEVAYAIHESIPDSKVRDCGGVWDHVEP